MKMKRALSFISLCILFVICIGCTNIKGTAKENTGKMTESEGQENKDAGNKAGQEPGKNRYTLRQTSTYALRRQRMPVFSI